MNYFSGTSINANTSILDNNRYNGRVNILEEEPSNIRFQMSEKIAIKNKATEYRDPLVGIFEETQLSHTYFSEANVQILQNGLRAGVYKMSQEKIVVPPQNVDQLKIIMRSIFLQYATFTDEPIRVQIEKLNSYVLDFAIKNVYNEAISYMNYCKDQSTLVLPLAMPEKVDRDYKPLEWNHWF